MIRFLVFQTHRCSDDQLPYSQPQQEANTAVDEFNASGLAPSSDAKQVTPESQPSDNDNETNDDTDKWDCKIHGIDQVRGKLAIEIDSLKDRLARLDQDLKEFEEKGRK